MSSLCWAFQSFRLLPRRVQIHLDKKMSHLDFKVDPLLNKDLVHHATSPFAGPSPKRSGWFTVTVTIHTYTHTKSLKEAMGILEICLKKPRPMLSYRQSILDPTQRKKNVSFPIIKMAGEKKTKPSESETANKAPGCSTSETSARSKSCLFFQAWTSIASQLLGHTNCCPTVVPPRKDHQPVHNPSNFALLGRILKMCL